MQVTKLYTTIDWEVGPWRLLTSSDRRAVRYMPGPKECSVMPPLCVALLKNRRLLLQLTSHMAAFGLKTRQVSKLNSYKFVLWTQMCHPLGMRPNLSHCHFGYPRTLIPLKCCPHYRLCMFRTVIPSLVVSCMRNSHQTLMKHQPLSAPFNSYKQCQSL